jgi:hypothetical protein
VELVIPPGSLLQSVTPATRVFRRTLARLVSSLLRTLVVLTREIGVGDTSP